MTYSGPTDNSTAVEYTASLITPPMPMNTSYCLQTEVLIDTAFVIALLYVGETGRGASEAKFETIVKISTSLGRKWHPVSYVITPSSSGEEIRSDDTFRVVFKGHLSNERLQPISAGIKYIAIKPAVECPLESKYNTKLYMN